jgi:Ca2+-binding EF-hand superfamily protein
VKLASLFAAVAVVAIPVFAQPGRGSYIQFHPLLSALDSDHDGVIDAAELAKASAVLRSLDRNQDGRITPDEMSPMMGRGGRGGFEGRGGRGREGEGPQGGAVAVEEAVKTYLALDKNGDGKLTRDEVPERMQGIFERGDANKDGTLTDDELRTMARAQQPAGGGMRGSREGGREGGRGPEGMMRMDPIFSTLDTNHDSVISGDEITNAASALKTLDKNQDGKLTEEEVRPNFGRGRG